MTICVTIADAETGLRRTTTDTYAPINREDQAEHRGPEMLRIEEVGRQVDDPTATPTSADNDAQTPRSGSDASGRNPGVSWLTRSSA